MNGEDVVDRDEEGEVEEGQRSGRVFLVDALPGAAYLPSTNQIVRPSAPSHAYAPRHLPPPCEGHRRECLAGTRGAAAEVQGRVRQSVCEYVARETEHETERVSVCVRESAVSPARSPSFSSARDPCPAQEIPRAPTSPDHDPYPGGGEPAHPSH